MEKERDIQQRIFSQEISEDKATEEEFFNVLRTISPGTNIRSALEGVLKAHKGALIVVESDLLHDMVDGGFRINTKFTAQKLIELSKMDGAIVLSQDMKRINLANTLMTPNNKTPTHETGTRHKAGERVARQARTLVIAISERRNEITVYYKNIRYPVVDSGSLLRKANEHIQLLEKQRELFDSFVSRLDSLELRNYPSLKAAIKVIQKGKTIQKLATDLRKYIVELGREGTLLKTRLKELISGVEDETDLVVKDYTNLDVKKSKAVLEELSYDELLEVDSILTALAYEKMVLREPIKGWRLLSRTSLEQQEVAEIIKQAGSLGKALYSNVNFHRQIIGEEKSRMFKEEVENIKLNAV